MTPETRTRFLAFIEAYKALCEKYQVHVSMCRYCDGAHLVDMADPSERKWRRSLSCHATDFEDYLDTCVCSQPFVHSSNKTP